MRTSQYLLSTLKNIPHDTKIISHQLMLRSGMIRKISSGLYVWLPTGIRVINKIQDIIKKEMKKIHALEISMPIIQPEHLWEQSKRLYLYGSELLKFSDRKKHKFILGPTNEEMVTYLIASEIHSYKELPLIIYQIQTKFRDEIRPRFGVIRSKEFTMKDAYSFHADKCCLEKTYKKFYKSYINIFKKINLDFRIIKADSGSMGGNISHEFQAFSKNGEDEIVFSENELHAENINTAISLETINFLKNTHKLNISKKNTKTKKYMIHFNECNIPIHNKIKTILLKTKKNSDSPIAALLIRGDHELNIFKIEKIKIFKKPLSFLNEKETIELMGTTKKFLGPLGLNIPIIADISTIKMKNFSIGSNVKNYFFNNVNWGIDLPVPLYITDIRKVTEKDYNPNNSNKFKIKKSIEIGHIFQLDQKYSKINNSFIKLKNGIKENLYMGCYGIGITRIIAAVIEQHHDKNGIIWPISIAPFHVVILPINIKKFAKIKETSYILYKKFKEKKIDVILYDEHINPGVMFNEIDLIGIPHQIIISENSIKNHSVEYCCRIKKIKTLIKINEITRFILNKINHI